LPSESSR